MGVILELTDCFEILGVQPGAHLRDIRSAFRRLALSCHPDVAGPHAAKQFETIAAAYAQLKSATPGQISESLKKKKANNASGRTSPFSWGENSHRRKRSDEEEKRKEQERSARVRNLLLEKTIVEAELALARILDDAARADEKRSSASLSKRILSTHPGVRLLALGSLGRKTPEKSVFSALLEMVRTWPPDDDTVEHLLILDLPEDKKGEMAAALTARGSLLSERSALSLIRWSAFSAAKHSVVRKMLSHPSPRVVSQALGRWTEKCLPDDLTLVRLLKRDDEEILVPLLRILRDKHLPAWASGRVKMLAGNHSSPAVRVWAQSIVRAQNLV
jgi:curved DNA-binding protein CbpA